MASAASDAWHFICCAMIFIFHSHSRHSGSLSLFSFVLKKKCSQDLIWAALDI